MLVVTFITLTMNAQERTRSYFCQQTSGPVSTGPVAASNLATFVEWYENGTIKMMDGTVWKYQGRKNGYHVYSFLKSTMMAMPGTQYQTAVFTADYSMMQINFIFGVGMPGFAVPMNSFYKYIGEGRQPAYDWINGRY